MSETSRTRLRWDQIVTLVGAIGPLAATLGAMGMVWGRLVTGRLAVVVVVTYFLAGIGVAIG